MSFNQPMENPRQNKILFAVDLDNLVANFGHGPNFSDALDAVLNRLSRIGRLVKLCAFGPELTLASFVDILRERGFVLVQCPKVVITKSGAKTEKKDTVDAELERVARIDIEQMGELTHLAIGSGDADFEMLVRWAKNQGLEIIVVAGNRRSLSPKIEALASRDSDGKKMIYYLSSEARTPFVI